METTEVANRNSATVSKETISDESHGYDASAQGMVPDKNSGIIAGKRFADAELVFCAKR